MWDRIASTFVGSLSAATGPARDLVDQLAQWGTHLAGHAAVKWLPRVTVEPRRCHLRGCKERAVVPCVSCECPTCIGHAFLNFEAEGICYECAAQTAKPPKPVRDALRALDLEDGADFEEVNRRYKKLVAEHHPDKQKSAAAKKKAEAKMKELNQAFAVLKKHFEGREAA
jgi:hypothetical protein